MQIRSNCSLIMYGFKKREKLKIGFGGGGDWTHIRGADILYVSIICVPALFDHHRRLRLSLVVIYWFFSLLYTTPCRCHVNSTRRFSRTVSCFCDSSSCVIEMQPRLICIRQDKTACLSLMLSQYITWYVGTTPNNCLNYRVIDSFR